MVHDNFYFRVKSKIILTIETPKWYAKDFRQISNKLILKVFMMHLSTNLIEFSLHELIYTLSTLFKIVMR